MTCGLPEAEWWQEDPGGGLRDSLAHVNQARWLEQQGADDLRICGCLFDSLNQLWTAFRMTRGARDDSDNRAFADMLVSIPDKQAMALCDAPALSHLVDLSPQVMNHDVLRRSPDYRPNQAIPRALARRAREAHGELLRAYERRQSSTCTDELRAVLKKLAVLLYVVRSNIVHGEKTPYGPDLEKGRRDREVCAVVRPLLWQVVEALLDRPGTRLAAYGTLAPGGPNHAMVSGLPGKWRQAKVEGVVSAVEGLPAFEWKTGVGDVDVWVLISPELEDRWPTLDGFEGTLYRRILVPAVFGDRSIAIANLYEAIGHDSR